LQGEQSKLEEILDKLRLDLSKNPYSEKKQNQLREYSSQFETFEVRKAEARDLIEKYGEEDIVLAGSLFVYMPQETTYLFS
ncbi:peptidoglycan bridge formation glycyltransferase FemA/FemB family protein, partial [Escherichia coli]|nr:peptidoglycan bridge formation glycyltransferase FemA/FemB family protein [Escherichia coli]